MKDDQKIKNLEDEIKILKNEIKSILLDVREQYLNIQNPFNVNTMPSAGNLMAGLNIESQNNQPVGNGGFDDTQNGTSDQSVEDFRSDVATESLPLINGEQPKSINSDNFSNMPVSLPVNEETYNKRIDDDNSVFGHESPDDDDDDSTDGEKVSFSRYKADKKKKKNGGVKGEVDLVVIAGLTQWIDQSTAKLGKEKTEILIEMSFTMGHLPENIKDALIKMTRISSNDSTDKTATASDYLAILAQLENLLTGSQLKENALLSILSMIKDTKNG